MGAARRHGGLAAAWGPRGGTMGPRGASFLLGRAGVAADAEAYLAEGLDKVVVGGFVLLIDDGHFLVGHGGGDCLHALDKADVLLDAVLAARAVHLRFGGHGERVVGVALLRLGGKGGDGQGCSVYFILTTNAMPSSQMCTPSS